jgi:hypothetical protein
MEGLEEARSLLLDRLQAEAALSQASRETCATSDSLARVIEMVRRFDLGARRRRPIGIGREVTDSWSLTADLSVEAVAFERAAVRAAR